MHPQRAHHLLGLAVSILSDQLRLFGKLYDTYVNL